MTIEDIYRVLDDKNDVIIYRNITALIGNKTVSYGSEVYHIGSLKDCDRDYMNYQVKSIKGWDNGLEIEIM